MTPVSLYGQDVDAHVTISNVSTSIASDYFKGA